MNAYISLILGVVIGFVVGWLIGRSRTREAIDNQQHLQNKLDEASTEIKRLQSKIEESGSKVQLVYKRADHLEDINGIGPVFAQRLNEAGINTFADLAAQTPERVKEIISPKNWQAVDPEGWISQARQLLDVLPASDK